MMKIQASPYKEAFFRRSPCSVLRRAKNFTDGPRVMLVGPAKVPAQLADCG